ncbi:MAG TPA: cytochrome P450 [Microbacterium sp.]|uniref:cytochrome P450 n=1 Tax=Microbacterium sp. TaxID=51671 RepID=UPI002C14F10B|nr:cytochrome P450 [Microbacterium sp.]HWI29965.1 cytochrome P450 [Microbacterium sp.]
MAPFTLDDLVAASTRAGRPRRQRTGRRAVLLRTHGRRRQSNSPAVAGTLVPPGEKVLMFLGAANRDPRRWANPDRFDLSRDPSGHVAFGMGLHQCVGQHIARCEATAVLGALLDRGASIELTAPPHRHLNNTLRGWESMPVRVALAAEMTVE